MSSPVVGGTVLVPSGTVPSASRVAETACERSSTESMRSKKCVQSRAPRPVRRVKATLPKSQLASVDTLGFGNDAEMRRTSRRNKKDTIRRRHRLPRMAGELSSAIAGTSPTASFS